VVVIGGGRKWDRCPGSVPFYLWDSSDQKKTICCSSRPSSYSRSQVSSSRGGISRSNPERQGIQFIM